MWEDHQNNPNRSAARSPIVLRRKRIYQSVDTLFLRKNPEPKHTVADRRCSLSQGTAPSATWQERDIPTALQEPRGIVPTRTQLISFAKHLSPFWNTYTLSSLSLSNARTYLRYLKINPILTTCKRKKNPSFFAVCQSSTSWYNHAVANPSEVTNGFARLIQHKTSYKTKKESHVVIYY